MKNKNNSIVHSYTLRGENKQALSAIDYRSRQELWLTLWMDDFVNGYGDMVRNSNPKLRFWSFLLTFVVDISLCVSLDIPLFMILWFFRRRESFGGSDSFAPHYKSFLQLEFTHNYVSSQMSTLGLICSV